MSTCIMPFNFYEPYNRDKFNEYFRTLKQAEDEKLEKYLLDQIPEQVPYKRLFSDYTDIYYLRDSIKALVDKLGRSYVKTTEEEEYLRLTRLVNDIKDQVNEVEKEKIDLKDRMRELDKKLDSLDQAYSEAIEDMLNASTKVGK